jgi:uncharacterized protein (TIGR02145 family)
MRGFIKAGRALAVSAAVLLAVGLGLAGCGGGGGGNLVDNDGGNNNNGGSNNGGGNNNNGGSNNGGGNNNNGGGSNGGNNTGVVRGTITDSRDGQTYKTVKIGGQTWMAENLNYAVDSSWCYDDDSANCNEYGRLYLWSAAMGISASYDTIVWGGSDVMHQGVCPSGWHLPSRQEWEALVTASGGSYAARILKTSTWGGTDDYGFSALPGGIRYSTYGYFEYAGRSGVWWTATEYENWLAYERGMSYNGDDVEEGHYNKSFGRSVRCVDGQSTNGGNNTGVVDPNTVVRGTITDGRDGTVYKTVKIGTQTWMAENLNYDTADGIGSWCYDNDPASCNQYGRLYDWNTAMAVCPSGWHLPSRDEWGGLTVAAGGTGTYGDGGKAGEALKSTSGWNNQNNGSNGNGKDDYGFSALPGGYRNDSRGSFGDAGIFGNWWTVTENGGSLAKNRTMIYNRNLVSENDNDKRTAFSVRCLKDQSSADSPLLNGTYRKQ